jgi:hypothetical protein
MKKFLSLILVVLLMVAFIGCSDNTTPEKVGNTDKTNEQGDTSGEDTQKTGENEIFKVGDTVKMGDLQFTVNGVRVSEGKTFKPDEGNVYLMVDITVENIGSEEESVSSLLMFKLVDKDGMGYDLAISDDQQGQLDGSLAAGRKMKGEITYEVPKTINAFELEIDPSLFGDGIAVFDITLS